MPLSVEAADLDLGKVFVDLSTAAAARRAASTCVLRRTRRSEVLAMISFERILSMAAADGGCDGHHRTRSIVSGDLKASGIRSGWLLLDLLMERARSPRPKPPAVLGQTPANVSLAPA